MSTMVEHWRKEGRVEGKAEGKADTIVLILNSKFGFIPDDVEKRINQITDIEQLNHLILFATRCQSLEDFEKELGPVDNA